MNIPKFTFLWYQTLTVGALGRGTSCVTMPTRAWMAHSDEQPMHTTVLRFVSMDFVIDGPVVSPARAVFSQSQRNTPAPPQVSHLRSCWQRSLPPTGFGTWSDATWRLL
jgi:hypothetical protein